MIHSNTFFESFVDKSRRVERPGDSRLLDSVHRPAAAND